MKQKLVKRFGMLIGAIFCVCLVACGGSKKQKEIIEDKPLNISVFLDLSDRLTRDLTPSQKERDIEAVKNIVQYYIRHTKGPAILKNKNKMKIFFYPAPSDENINSLADSLSIDMAQLKGIDKRIAVDKLIDKFSNNMSKIYDLTLMQKKWIGCDIWDFFSNGRVDKQCIEKDYRNIIIILTDGYIFHRANKIKEGNSYSYILPQTLAIDGSSLIAKRKGLDNLEVLMLELNLYDAKYKDKMKSILTKWFTDMGVQRFEVEETDIPANTKTFINRFLDQN